MHRRHLPTAYRKHGQGLTKQNFALSRADLDNLAEVRSAFENAHGVVVSTSIILGLALQALIHEVRSGRVRWSDDLRSTVRSAQS